MKKNLKFAGLALAVAIMISGSGLCSEKATVKPAPVAKGQITQASQAVNYQTVDPMELVANPKNYLNKNIEITALFDKFSTIGLDYPPVNKSSKDYISFMIKRPDVQSKDYSIPYSEIKFIIKRDKAEKLIDLESGDKIKITGKVFSDALGDPWVDVDEVKVLEAKTKTSKKDKK